MFKVVSCVSCSYGPHFCETTGWFRNSRSTLHIVGADTFIDADKSFWSRYDFSFFLFNFIGVCNKNLHIVISLDSLL